MPFLLVVIFSILSMACNPLSEWNHFYRLKELSETQAAPITRVLPYGSEGRGGTSILFEAIRYYAAKRLTEGRPLVNAVVTEEATSERRGTERISVVDGVNRLHCHRSFYDSLGHRSYGLHECEVTLASLDFQASALDEAMATVLYKSLSSYAAKLRLDGREVPFVVNRSNLRLEFGNHQLDALELAVSRGLFVGRFQLQLLRSYEDFSQLSEQMQGGLIKRDYKLHPSIERVAATKPIDSLAIEDMQVDGFYKEMKAILENEINLYYPGDQVDWPYANIGGIELEALALRLDGRVIGGSLEARQYGCSFDVDSDDSIWEPAFLSIDMAREAGCDPEADVSWAGRAAFFGDLSIIAIDPYMEWTGH